MSILEDFYIEQLGFKRTEQSGVMIGETELVFEGGPGEPFYHFALLVPGNRFDEALEWIAERTVLLPDPEGGQVVFDFDNWDALACYFHDPVGNIVELIAHRGVDETGTVGPFSAAEVVGFSELGLVGDKSGAGSSTSQRARPRALGRRPRRGGEAGLRGPESEDVHRLSGGPRLATDWATGRSASV